jgi:hypothetical protein
MISAMEAWPIAACVPVVHGMTPTLHVGPATVQIWAATALTEVVGILPEETSAINWARSRAMLPATCANTHPSISCITTSVPEIDSSMTTTLKHFNPRHAPSTNMFASFADTPAMTAIIVDRVSIIDPQFASVVRIQSESVMASAMKSHATCPADSKVVMSGKPRPSSTCVPVHDIMTPAHQLWPATDQVRSPTALTKVEGILSEETMAISYVVAIRPCT